jgi:hypothetical protein
MQNFDQSLFCIWKMFYLAYLTIYPAFLIVFTINERINFDLFGRKTLGGRIVTVNEVIKIYIKLKGIKCIPIS